MYTIQDALVESQHNKIKATLDDGTRIVLERVIYGPLLSDRTWLFHAAGPGRKYASWELKEFVSVTHMLREYCHTSPDAAIWLPIELAQQLPTQDKATQ